MVGGLGRLCASLNSVGAQVDTVYKDQLDQLMVSCCPADLLLTVWCPVCAEDGLPGRGAGADGQGAAAAAGGAAGSRLAPVGQHDQLLQTETCICSRVSGPGIVLTSYRVKYYIIVVPGRNPAPAVPPDGPGPAERLRPGL